LGGLSGALLSGVIYEYFPDYLFLSSSLIALVAFVMIGLYKRDEASIKSLKA